MAMAENHIPLPTCVLKVDMSCCEDCPIKVKEKLQRINGVYYINIDTKKELVLVSGTVEPSTIQKKMGKKAELLAYEENSTEAKKRLHQFLRNKQKEQHNKNAQNCCSSKDKKTTQCKPKYQTCYCHYSYSDSDDEEHCNGVSAIGEVHQRKFIMKDELPNYQPRVYGNHYQVAPSWYARPYYMKRPYGYPGFNYHATYNRPSQPPEPPPLKPPPPPPALSNVYAFYSGQTEAPVGNSLFHSFSDENVRACSVM